MMIHEKLLSGQFLLDFNNDRPSLLLPHQQPPTASQNHQLHQQQHQTNLMLHHQPASPPMSNMSMEDIYAAYAYHHHQQQQQRHHLQLLAAAKNSNGERTNPGSSSPEIVLDLSRRCDSVETPRKTPSPYQINSSVGTGSPASSPVNTHEQMLEKSPTMLPNNLLFSPRVLQQQQRGQTGCLAAGLGSLYPSLYYQSNSLIKAEPPLADLSPLTTPPPANSVAPVKVTAPATFSLPPELPRATEATTTATNLLQTFATTLKSSEPRTQVTPKSENSSVADATSPNSDKHQNSPALSPLEAKHTRPFKAFPRDPFVIAANFAAADVLIDNPRVERYTEYRKRILEQIRLSNGGSRTVTNPKMRRTSSRSTSVADGESVGSNYRSSSEERNADGSRTRVEESSSDCESNAGNFNDKIMSTMASSGSSIECNANAKPDASDLSSTNDKSVNSSSNNTGTFKDAAYYERRRKNNAAAKKSRDRRRIKEDEIAIRAAYLERQNIELLCQIDALKAQLATYTKVGA